MNTRSATTALGALMLVAGAAVALSTGPDHDLTWRTIDGGGGQSSGGAFAVHGTVGQPDAGPTLTGGVFELTGGFWSAPAPAPPCAGDVDGNQIVDVGDIIAVLAAWGACPGCPADLDDDGFVDFEDLLLVLANYGPCD